MRTRQAIERDLAQARTRLTAAEAGDRTNRVAYYAACAAAQRDVQRFEQELASLPAAVIPPPSIPPVVPVVVTHPPTGGSTPQTIPATRAALVVRPVRRRSAATVAQISQAAGSAAEELFPTWLLVVLACVAAVLLVAFLATRPPRTGNVGGDVSALSPVPRQQSVPTHQPVLQSQEEQPEWTNYRDCVSYWVRERGQFVEGRCDHLQ